MSQNAERGSGPTPSPHAADPAPSQPGLGRRLPMPHERDESVDSQAQQPLDPVVVQAKKDLDAGLVDTDLRNAPGADAEQRARLLGQEVPGAGSGAKSRAGEAAPATPSGTAGKG